MGLMTHVLHVSMPRCSLLGAVMNVTCQSCSWSNMTDQPSMALAFLKTRKSGSTNFDGIVASLASTFAVLHQAHQQLHDEGSLSRHRRRQCTSNRRQTVLFALSSTLLFTILRGFIERIGSQAFYSREVVGSQTIVLFIAVRCAFSRS